MEMDEYTLQEALNILVDQGKITPEEKLSFLSLPRTRKNQIEKAAQDALQTSRGYFASQYFGKGGTPEGLSDSTVRHHLNTFDKTPAELHNEYKTGGKRQKLPRPHQIIIALQEENCAEAIRDTVIETPDNRASIDRQLYDVVDETSEDLMQTHIYGTYHQRVKLKPQSRFIPNLRDRKALKEQQQQEPEDQ